MCTLSSLGTWYAYRLTSIYISFQKANLYNTFSSINQSNSSYEKEELQLKIATLNENIRISAIYTNFPLCVLNEYIQGGPKKVYP